MDPPRHEETGEGDVPACSESSRPPRFQVIHASVDKLKHSSLPIHDLGAMIQKNTDNHSISLKSHPPKNDVLPPSLFLDTAI